MVYGVYLVEKGMVYGVCLVEKGILKTPSPVCPLSFRKFLQLPQCICILAMTSKFSSNVENQGREWDAYSKEISDQSSVSTTYWDTSENKTSASVLIEDWDLPENQENPRNWSACKP